MMIIKRVYPVFLCLMILFTISSCIDPIKINEKTDPNTESLPVTAPTNLEKYTSEAAISTPAPQEKIAITSTFPNTRTQVPQEEMTITPTFPAYPRGGTGDGWQAWFWSQENPLDEFKMLFDIGYTEIVNIVYGDNVWLATLLNHDNYLDSFNFYENMDEAVIDQLLLDDNKIKIICPGDGGWLVVTTKDNNYLDQRVIFTSEFNLDEINRIISEGYWVTDLRYWDNQWVVVLTETADILDQKIEIVSDIGPNRSHIDLMNSYFYTSIVYDGQQWIVVRSDLAEYNTQSLVIHDILNKNTIYGSGWNEGYSNIKIFYGNDQWIYVFTK